VTDVRASHGRVGAFSTVVLENQYLRAVIIPALGGRVWELEDRVRGRQWIWHREGVSLAATEPGADYDTVWAGGWEELFPNDAPGRFEGRELPDHGEWWTLSWTIAEMAGGPSARVCLNAESSIMKAACTKEFTLRHDDSTLGVSYRIRSKESEACHFLFKQHLPIQVTPGCRLVVPGGQVQAVAPSFGNLLPGPGPYEWPIATAVAGPAVDLRIVPPASDGSREFVYVTNLPDHSCGVEDTERAASLVMKFEGRQLPFLWLFLSYGGWRDTYTAVLEPCTNMPKDLGEAVRQGQSARLKPGEEFVTTVSVTLGGPLEARR
jgi:hypothetical protein